jgi:hypothetical protein
MKKYEFQVSEPFEYSGPSPINLELLGRVTDESGKEYCLFKVLNIFDEGPDVVSQIVATFRSEGSSLDELETTGTTVGAARVKPGSQFQPGKKFSLKDTHYSYIGSVKPVS